MALHNVAVQATVHEHGALQVHQVAFAEQAEVGAVEGFLDGGYLVHAVGVYGHHGEAHAVVGY